MDDQKAVFIGCNLLMELFHIDSIIRLKFLPVEVLPIDRRNYDWNKP